MKALFAIGVLLLAGSVFVGFSVYAINPSSFAENFQFPGAVDSVLGLAALGVLSLVLSAVSIPKRCVKIIGVVLLAIGVIIPSLFAYEIFLAPPLIGCLGCTGPQYFVVVGGSITQSPSGSWNLTIWAKNDGQGPVTMISVTNSSSLPQSTSLVFDYRGAVVSSHNLLPVEQTAVGQMQVPNLTEGETYSMVVSIIGQGEVMTIETLSMTATT